MDGAGRGGGGGGSGGEIDGVEVLESIGFDDDGNADDEEKEFISRVEGWGNRIDRMSSRSADIDINTDAENPTCFWEIFLGCKMRRGLERRKKKQWVPFKRAFVPAGEEEEEQKEEEMEEARDVAVRLIDGDDAKQCINRLFSPLTIKCVGRSRVEKVSLLF